MMTNSNDGLDAVKSKASSPDVNIRIDDTVNMAILRVSEDQVQGFQEDPFGEISRLSGIHVNTVMERIKGMLIAGTIRRVRQTLLATNLAQGSLVAWQLPEDKLEAAFEYMFQNDPFTGHVVIRSTDSATAGSNYRLWTTLKVPQGYSMKKHADYLQEQTGAIHYRLMPAKRVFALGVGHMRRQGMEPGSKADVAADPIEVEVVQLSELDWRVLTALKREFKPEELVRDIWVKRAAEVGISVSDFYEIAHSLNERKVIGRFSTFLEHVKPVAGNQRVTRYNALFHWAVEPGREIDAGKEVGRFHIMTHAYWRDGGTEFRNVNIMGVAHGGEKTMVLEHKAAIDKHLADCGIPVHYTNVFWGGRSEIKPSEIAPEAYLEFCERHGLNPADLME